MSIIKSSSLWSFLGLALCILLSFSFKAHASNSGLFSKATAKNLFNQRVAGLNDEEIDLFMLGRSFFAIPWVEAPSATTARDGLGPIFNANTCNSCHQKQNSATPFNADGSVHRSLVFKLSKPTLHHIKSYADMLVPDSTYGAQIGINGTKKVPFEAKTDIKKQHKVVRLADNTKVVLTSYQPVLSSLNYGALDKETKVSLRQAPAIIGVGLIERIPKAQILALAKAQQANKDGISGRVNWVVNPVTKKKTLGRFGYKASQDSIMMQTADAAANDMGLTNAFFPHELCSKKQTACMQAPKGRASPQGKLDLPPTRLAAISFFLAKQKAPKPVALNKAQLQGQKLFAQAGCNVCHQPSFKLDDKTTIHPYSDFLLHDLGAELADGRSEFMANEKEWKTTPLWGIGHRVRTERYFLHDGRAKSVQEAILWHGGEAQAAKQNFTQLKQTQRQQLIQFLETL